MAAQNNTLESKRVRRFRFALAKLIPKFPNNRETLSALEAKSLPSLLVDYINWACRLIPPRPRKVIIEPSLTADPRWKVLAADTKALLRQARRGDDLNPHLSLRALHNGYTPATSIPAPSTDKWADKDFFLITMGYHHFHLSQVIETAGHTKRTDEVLFAQVTKEQLTAIGFFDHSVFEPTSLASPTMTTERSRLWETYDRRSSAGRMPGVVYAMPPITTSGHSLFHTRLASDFAQTIYRIDPQLDDLSSRSAFFNTLPHEAVKAMKLQWHLNHLDLGLLDKAASVFHVLRWGPI